MIEAIGLTNFFAWLRGLPRHQKMGIAVAVDGLLVSLATSLLAMSISSPDWTSRLQAPLFQLMLVAGSCWFFLVAGLYRAVVRYIGAQTLRLVVMAALASGGLFFCLSAWQIPGLGAAYAASYAALLLGLMVTLRLAARGLLTINVAPAELQPVVIFGAGRAGSELASALQRSSAFRPVAFLDDDTQKVGTIIRGVPVYPRTKLTKVLEKTQARHLFLAVPRLSRDEKRRILETVAPHSIRVQSVPHLDDLIASRASIDALEEVAIEDILGRDPVPPDFSLLGEMLSGKSVLVTGAGGSIGSELCRQIVSLQPERLVLFEVSEYALYALERELNSSGPCTIVPVLGSVLDKTHLEAVMRRERTEVVYHAAAYKHVPLVEANPAIGVKNNVEGTWKTLLAAQSAGVRSFTLVSTDKAVNPTNVMGASKRVAELIVQAHAEGNTKMRCAMVRFGNVLGSSGSVFPLFRAQIAKGGPVTVTHPEVTRYFMTIPEAAQLVLQASAMTEGGEVFVLDMGQPVKILDLAKRLIQLSGRTYSEGPGTKGAIEICVTGLRPGEKLYEELLIGDKALPSKHPRVMRALERHIPMGDLGRKLNELDEACLAENQMVIRRVLATLVESFPEAPVMHEAPRKPSSDMAL